MWETIPPNLKLLWASFQNGMDRQMYGRNYCMIQPLLEGLYDKEELMILNKWRILINYNQTASGDSE